PRVSTRDSERSVNNSFPNNREHRLQGTPPTRNLFFQRSPRKRIFLIPRARIFDSSVERAMPSRAAAPDGPYTRPSHARRASSIIAFSWLARVLDNACGLLTAGPADSQLSSTVNSSLSHTITDRSITFCSSRTFPGQGYDCRRSSIPLLTRRIVLPAFRA